jgi:hypothetical protein
MAGDFCDWEPCSWLQKYVFSLLPKDRSADTVQVDALRRPLRVNGKAGEIRRVTFYYCPFCGTRLTGNKEILEWIQKKRGCP